MNTLLSAYRVCFDISFNVCDEGSRFIYEQLIQIYDKLSKIKKGIVFNIFQTKFKLKNSWSANNLKDYRQFLLLKSVLTKKPGAALDGLKIKDALFGILAIFLRPILNFPFS